MSRDIKEALPPGAIASDDSIGRDIWGVCWGHAPPAQKYIIFFICGVFRFGLFEKRSDLEELKYGVILMGHHLLVPFQEM